jgi:hypothetical protein
MPVPSVAATGQAVMPEPLLADAAFSDWVADRGPVTYAEYLALHPWSTLTAPLEDLVADRPAFAEERHVDQTMLSPGESYGSSRPVIPEPLETLLFGPGGTGAVLTAVVAVVALSGLRRRTSGWESRWLVPLTAIGLPLPALVLIWHTSTAELGRLALVSAVILRIGLLVQLAFLADGWRSDRAAVARRARVGVSPRTGPPRLT